MSESNPSSAARSPLQLPRELEVPSRGDQVRSLKLPKHVDSRSSLTTWLIWGLVVVLLSGIVVLSVAAYGRHLFRTGNQESGSAQSSDAKTPAPGVPETSAPPRLDKPAADTEIALESRGYIIPAHQILVSPEVTGRLIKLTLEEGMRVRQGDVLAQVDPTDFENDHARAQALRELSKQRLQELENGFRREEIAQAEQELQESQAQLTQLESQWRRAYELMRSNTAAQEQYELVEGNYNAMRRRVERLRLAHSLMQQGPRAERILAARAEVQQYEAELAKARWRLDKCVIRAPISGTILRKNAEEGNVVNPIAFNGSYSICEMADLSDLEVQLDIQERDVARVFKGQRCRVRSEAFPERIYEGQVSRLMPIADRAKGAVPVRVKLQVPADEEGVYLKPEMAVTVTFLRKETGPPSG